jgi:protein-L-isoaspartate O-methyltransferase
VNHRTLDLRARWEAAARLVADSRDLLDGRPMPSIGSGDPEPPAALVARGWASFLLACDDAQLASFEVGGHEAEWPDGTPASLLALIEAARAICAVPAFPPAAPAPARPSSSSDSSRPARRRETPRKRAQVDAFARVILPLAADAERVVDVGSGHGHLTRAIAERIARPVVGLERDVALADRARSLSSEDAPSPTFSRTDVMRDGLAITGGDCVIGLHACGELGDAMVSSVARRGAAIALVGCCLQKRSALSRTPLVDARRFEGALDLPRDLLGLSNLTARDDGVEASRAENLAGRERRLALHRLLSDGGPALRLGSEIEGLNRRAAQGDLASLVSRAFAFRWRPAPPRVAVEEAAVWARSQHARLRRFSLPRAMLARVVEVFVLLDRARHLEERGHDVAIGTLFPLEVSARNLVLVAKRGRQ